MSNRKNCGNIFVILSMLIVLTLPFVTNAATEIVHGIAWTYFIKNGEATVGGDASSQTAVPTTTSGGITIPSTLGGYSVTSIGSSAFSGCSSLTSVAIPDSVTSIGWCAFSGCSGLTSVTIPDSVTSIGSGAFSGCSGLIEMTIPFVGLRRGNSGTHESFFGYIFGTDSYSGSIEVSYDYWTSSGYLHCYIPSKLKSVFVTSETIIGYQAFRGCIGLENVTIPDSVTSIGDFAFDYCSGLENMTIPDSVTSIGDSAFSGCDKLWAKWYKNASLTTAQGCDPRYDISNAIGDRVIASITVSEDAALDDFVLPSGKVYDSVVYITNTASTNVDVSMPDGHLYKTLKWMRPLTIPANSSNILTITRIADNTFLLSRQELEAVQ